MRTLRMALTGRARCPGMKDLRMARRRFEGLSTHIMARAVATGFIASLLAGAVSASPGGTPYYQTDVGPFCAGCHSSTAIDDLSGLGERATA